MARVSEGRAEDAARDLLAIRGWDTARPPKGNVLWKNEYHDYPVLLESLSAASKHGDGAGYPDFIVVDPRRSVPLMIGETKADPDDINKASQEAGGYANAFSKNGIEVLAIGVAGSAEEKVAVRVQKRENGRWRPIEYRKHPIEWLPTPDETDRLLLNPDLFALDPEVPPTEILESKADEINRILRECRIKDERRPAAVAAFMLGLWKTSGQIRTHSEHVLSDINAACRKAFRDADKHEIDDVITVDSANQALANQAHRIIRILRLLNVTTLTGAHDYLGQLYEHFFRFTGANTIGQFFTPRHVTRFMANLCDVTENDTIVDPACGTGGFLIASLYRMIGDRHLTHAQVKALVKNKIWGFESEPITAGLCIANMILRGDGTSGVVKGDCFTDAKFPVGRATVALGNPPFPHKGSDEQPEKFVDRALEALRVHGLMAMIVPASMLVKGGVKEKWRRLVLRDNTLRAVIKLPDELFEPYATAYTNIAIIEKGVPHKAALPVFFGRIENDGFRLKKSVRVARAGEQFTEILDAFHSRQEKPGWYSWRPVDSADWSPGAYIESAAAGEQEIRREVDLMLRSDAALHANHADRMADFYRRVASGALAGRKYSQLSNNRAHSLQHQPELLGHYFNVYYGQRDLHSKEWLEQGDSIIISSAGEFNGCFGFFKYGTLIKPPFATVPSTGSIGVGFVQRLPCGVTDDCLLLFPKSETPDEALYVAAAVARLERWRFSYGRKITPARLAVFKLPLSDSLLAWVKRRRDDTAALGRSIVKSMADEKGSAEDLKHLLSRWEKERPRAMNISAMAAHPIYQSIISMGTRAIPLLLAELARKPAHWFVALHEITGENPIEPADEGKVGRMAEAWLRWGKQQGYIGDLD